MYRIFSVFLLLALQPVFAQGDVSQTSRTLTQGEQQELSPVDTLRLLRQGNERFVDGDLTSRDHSAQIRSAALGQFPKAMILSCVDSRIPVEDVFDLGIGDIFVARVAGNFENTDILGSMEFAAKVSGGAITSPVRVSFHWKDE